MRSPVLQQETYNLPRLMAMTILIVLIVMAEAMLISAMPPVFGKQAPD